MKEAIEFLPVNKFATNRRVRIKKHGHTFEGYTGVVHDYWYRNGKVKQIDVRLDDGQDMKGGNGFTVAKPSSLELID